MRIVTILIFCYSFLLCIDSDVQPHVRAESRSVKSDSGRKFDEYGLLSFKHEKKRLNNLAEQLKTEPNSKGYIVVYAGQPSRIKVARDRARRATDYLVNKYGTDPSRIIAAALDSGLHDEFTVELWIWPIDAPDDLPKVLPDIRSREVLIIKGTEIDNGKGRGAS